MPNIEVDETEFLNNRKLSELVGKMLKNPEARRRVLEAQKIIDPNTVIPEIDSAKPVHDAVTALGDKFDKALAEIREERTKEKEEKRLEELRANGARGSSFSASTATTR